VVFDAPVAQIFRESGDLMAVEEPLRTRLHTDTAMLPSVVAAGPSKRGLGEISLFKSVGTAAQDIASAKAIYDLALELGIGREIGELTAPKLF